MSPRPPELRSNDGARGRSYNVGRHTDARIAAKVHAALGDASTVLNVGAGGGIYEPDGRSLTTVESSATLPFGDDEFDAAMACATLHHWDDPAVGLRELRRVARGPVVILTFDLAHLVAWQRDYLAPLIEIERRRHLTPAEIAAVLGRRTRIDALRTPTDCEDGFLDAYWSRPEALLDPRVRATQSAWSLISDETEREIVERLRADLASGVWAADHGYLRSHKDHDGALRLIVAPH